MPACLSYNARGDRQQGDGVSATAHVIESRVQEVWSHIRYTRLLHIIEYFGVPTTPTCRIPGQNQPLVLVLAKLALVLELQDMSTDGLPDLTSNAETTGSRGGSDAASLQHRKSPSILHR